jgi:hypothetical protein
MVVAALRHLVLLVEVAALGVALVRISPLGAAPALSVRETMVEQGLVAQVLRAAEAEAQALLVVMVLTLLVVMEALERHPPLPARL